MKKAIQTLFILASMLFAGAADSDAKCIIFNNLDSWSDPAYISYIKKLPAYSGRFDFMPFSNSTFAAKPITDYELAFFPMGDEPLNASTDGQGTNVIITKIKEMIDSGRSVIITGRKLLWWAFNTHPDAAAGKDPGTVLFLSKTLGINYLGTIPIATTDGTTTTYRGFIARGTPKDPVGDATVKYCNVKYGSDPNYSEPIAYHVGMDIFKLSGTSESKDVDHYISVDMSPITDTLIGMRIQIGKSRIILLSYGNENIAVDFQRENFIRLMLNWCLEAAPVPGAQIEKLQSELQYGSVVQGDKPVLTAEFINSGSETLVVDSIYIDDSLFETGGFRIVDNLKFPIIREHGDTFRVNVEFNPADIQTYYALLTVLSNSKSASKETVDLRGIGIAGTGPRIASNFPGGKISFDKTVPNQKNEKTLIIYNRGNENLSITDGKVLPVGTPVYLDGFKKYYTIKPGDSLVQKLRFQPTQENMVYDGEIVITSNAVDNNQFKIAVHGESDFFGDVENKESSDKVLSVNPNPASDKIEVIINTESDFNGRSFLEIHDTQGRLMKSIVINTLLTGSNKIEIDLGSLYSGAYILNLKLNGTTFCKKFIINK